LARTVLLADDSVTAQNMGRRILIDAGYEVVTVNNGSAALKKAHESRPDLIVLDVYMPGYGGLEVCQRLKESEETARIPILLTVGKMEPFKPEEARRARADAHIVKPFEASELLAALTRLEDRIVPQPHPEPSRGRKSKSEKRPRSLRVTDPAMSFDDTQSEKIAYLAQVKQRSSAVEAEARTEDAHKHSNEVGNGQVEADSPPAQSFSDEEMPAAPSKPRMPMPMSVYAASQLQELPVVAEPAPVEQGSTVRQGESAPNGASSEQNSGATEIQAVSAAGETSSVPAESSLVGSKEAEPASSENLENLPAVIESAAPVFEGQPSQEMSTLTDASEPEISVAQSETEIAANANQVAQSEEVPAEPPQTVASARWVAENVALTAEEAALELEREMHEVRAQSTSAVPAEAEVTTQAQPERSTPEEFPKSEETKGATFAAAASASSSTAVGTTFPEAESEPPVPSEAAAAWENWRHIRDSAMGSETAIPLSESVAEVVQGNVPEPTTEAVPANVPAGASESTEAPANADSENAAISSIVDSVLAELKPKLMAEISKKLKK
jgi:CheY-like chemotaxis protein